MKYVKILALFVAITYTIYSLPAWAGEEMANRKQAAEMKLFKPDIAYSSDEKPVSRVKPVLMTVLGIAAAGALIAIVVGSGGGGGGRSTEPPPTGTGSATVGWE